MVAPKPPFLSDRDIQELYDVYGSGMKTVENWQDPKLVLTIERRTNTGWVAVVENLKPIYCKAPGASIRDAAGREVRRPGILRVWAESLAGIEIEIKDRFLWGEDVCVIEATPAERLGTFAFEFSILEG